jgi:hypothetical protein
MTYTALLSLSMLQDDFSRLNRPGLLRFVGSCQNRNGRFAFGSHPFVADWPQLFQHTGRWRRLGSAQPLLRILHLLAPGRLVVHRRRTRDSLRRFMPRVSIALPRFFSSYSSAVFYTDLRRRLRPVALLRSPGYVILPRRTDEI